MKPVVADGIGESGRGERLGCAVGMSSNSGCRNRSRRERIRSWLSLYGGVARLVMERVRRDGKVREGEHW